jgi:hypothetical protein
MFPFKHIVEKGAGTWRSLSESVLRGWGSADDLHWVEKTIPVNPKKTCDIWKKLYKAIREGADFPITLAQSVEVMRVITEARRRAGF